MAAKKIKIASIDGRCFWCVEAVFKQINGVEKIVSGYSGGTAPGSPPTVKYAQA